VVPSREQVLRVLSIAHEHSGLRGGRGLSLRYLIEAADYRALRPRVQASQLAAVLQAEPHLANDWLAYSEDKRTSFGWGFGPSREGEWLVEGPEGICEVFASRFDACANDVLRELDFWAVIGNTAEPDAAADPGHGPRVS
jgi:hypothetical protein